AAGPGGEVVVGAGSGRLGAGFGRAADDRLGNTHLLGSTLQAHRGRSTRISWSVTLPEMRVRYTLSTNSICAANAPTPVRIASPAKISDGPVMVDHESGPRAEYPPAVMPTPAVTPDSMSSSPVPPTNHSVHRTCREAASRSAS